MGLQDRGARLGIIELVVGIGAIALVLDEPLGPVQLADIVIQSARADQVHIGMDRPGPFFGQAANHQGVLKGAGGFTGEAPQQGPLQVGQLQQPGPGEQVEGALHQRTEQEAHHQQPHHQQGFPGQVGGQGQRGLRAEQGPQLQQQPLQGQGPQGQQQGQLQQLGPTALASRQHRGGGGHGGGHHHSAIQSAIEGHGPEQGGPGQPGQPGGRAQALGQQQGGGHQQGQRAHRRPQPKLEALHPHQHRQGQQGLARFEGGAPAAADQHDHGAGR